MSEEKSESGRKRSFEEALGSIPVFPLPHVVLFPHAILPLHIFEPRYRRMLADCLATHGAMVVAQILREDSSEDAPKIARIAGGGIVVEHQPLLDGRSNIVLLGRARLRLDHIDPEDCKHPYRRARATILRDDEVTIGDADRTALVAAATMFATEVKKHDPHFSFRVPAVTDAGTLADVCAYQLIVDAAARQVVLEELDPRVRVQMVMNQLALQHGAMIDDRPAKVLN